MAVVWKTDGVIEDSSAVVFSGAKQQYFNNFSGTYTYDFSTDLNNLKNLYGENNYTIDSVEFIFEDHFILKGKDIYATGDYFVQYASAATGTISKNNAITNIKTFNYTDLTSNISLTGTTFTITNLTSFLNTLKNGEFSVRIAKFNSGSSSDKVYYGPSSNYTNPVGTMICRIKYSYKVTVPDPTLTAPSNLRFYNYTAGDAQYYLTWDRAIGSNGTGEVTYYIAERTTQTTLLFWEADADTIIGPFISPPAGTTYQFSIYAQYSGITNTSAPTYSLTFQAASTPALGTPSIESLIPTAGSTSYTISWNSVAGATSYTVKYRPSGGSSWINATTTTGTSHSGTVPTFGTYEFKVVASNSFTTEDSAIVLASFVQATAPIRPKITSIKHTPGAATFEITWSEAQIPGFSGTIKYWLWDYTSGSYLFSDVTGNQATVEVPQYDVASELYLCAYYNSTSLWANETNKYTFQSAQSKPSITFEPNFNYSVLQGTSITISWDNFTVSGTDYSNFYYIFYYRKITNGIAGDGVMYASSTVNERTISQTEFLNELGASEGQQYNFGVLAFVYGLTNTSSGSSLSSGIKWSSDIFTYSNAANISLTKPGNPSITQHSTQATFSISWTASIGTGGSGSVTYDIMDAMNGTVIVSNLTTTTRSGLSIPVYGKYEYKIRARYSGQEQVSDIVECTFEAPSIRNFGEIYITPTEGPSVKVSWKPATLRYTTGTINYKLWCKKNSTGSDSNWIEFGDIGDKTEQTVDETWLSTYGASGDKFYFQVDVHVTNLSHIANDQTKLTDGTSFAEPFTFITGNTIGYYYNNAWRECTVYYYGWNSTTQRYEWIECIPYYYNGGWREINTKIE